MVGSDWHQIRLSQTNDEVEVGGGVQKDTEKNVRERVLLPLIFGFGLCKIYYLLYYTTAYLLW